MKKKLLSGAIQAGGNSHSHPVSTRETEIKKGKPVGDLCLEIARFARDRDYRTLDFLLRMAAAEAYDQTSETLETYSPGKGELVGMWDWDVSNNLAYVDPPAAQLFDVDPRACVRGLPVEDYIKAIHPDDVADFSATLYQVANEGGCFKKTYRIVNNDRIVWIYARGSCFIGPSKIPVRFPGALFDITASMTD